MREPHSESMSDSRASRLVQGPPQYEDAETSSHTIFLPLRGRPQTPLLNNAVALVASSDQETLQALAEIVLLCGLAAFTVSSVTEAKRMLRRHKVYLVVCEDRLSDGKYEDILKETARLLLKAPVIVVSRTGDWPDYLKAVGAGAFDFVSYPPVPADLPRVIRHALMSQKESGDASGTANASFSEGEML
jgi:DNA-binding NtrC family response regulator